MTPEKWHVIGYTWKQDKIFLQVRALQPGAITQDIELNGEFNFKKTSERRCVGWIDFSKLEIMPCPDMASGDIVQCEACKQREGFMRCVMCNGFSCPPLKPSVEAYCRQTHHLYLACFGSKQVKVGTASDARKYTRILEQGPLAAAFVATAPGPTIKQIEHTVSGMGYTEAMNRSEKRLLLTSSMGEDEAQKLVLDAFTDVSGRIPENYEHYFHKPEIVTRPVLAVKSRVFNSLDELKPETDKILGGEIVGASGNLLILNDGVGASTLDLTLFKSWIIEINPDGPRTTRVKQLQLL